MTYHQIESTAAALELVARLRNYDQCHDGDIDKAADVIEQFASKQVPKIKPLVWEECKYDDGWQISEMPLCDCYVMHREGEYKAPKAYQAHVHKYTEWFDTEAEAKAWCEQEYERRVRECME